MLSPASFVETRNSLWNATMVRQRRLGELPPHALDDRHEGGAREAVRFSRVVPAQR
jgi:hypothetical protein